MPAGGLRPHLRTCFKRRPVGESSLARRWLPSMRAVSGIQTVGGQMPDFGIETVEDPITFDVWGCSRVGKNQLAREYTGSSLSGRPRCDLLRLLEPVNKGQHCLIASDITWQNADELRQDLSPWIADLQVFQSHWGPSRLHDLHWCDTHQFHYAGVIGCHVCSGINA